MKYLKLIFAIWAFLRPGCSWLRVRYGAAHSGYRLTITIPNAKVQMASFVTILLVFCSCNNPKNDLGKNAQTPVFTDKNEVAEKKLEVEITVERGAFHYDKFILKDTTITFYPSDELIYEGDYESAKKYGELSKQAIPKQALQNFVNILLKSNIWKMKGHYKEWGSCTSLLTVTIQINDKSTKIECDDFQRSCPELIQFIETEMVRLHGAGLERIYLPG